MTRGGIGSITATNKDPINLLDEASLALFWDHENHAQRDVVDWTLTEAAVRAGHRDIALPLAHERLVSRPRSAPTATFSTKPKRSRTDRAPGIARVLHPSPIQSRNCSSYSAASLV
jgi:hypothetical protein